MHVLLGESVEFLGTAYYFKSKLSSDIFFFQNGSCKQAAHRRIDFALFEEK